jgi:hypothetical protein
MTQPQLYAFTSAACNYLPKVRLLVQSFKRYHPEIRLVLALSDAPPNSELIRGEAWDEIIPVEALGIPEWRRWAFTHDIVELSTAIKPFVLSRLLERPDCAGVFYFDPDMVLFSRLDDLIAGLDESDVLLTPHLNKPEIELPQVMDNEISCLKHGTYNLGFIGVRPSVIGLAFARWWADRAYYFCRDDIPNGLFTDQRWIDLAPALFDGVKVVRSSRFNVAPWNLTTRNLSGDLTDGLLVDGEPLGFYHFTGFDSGAHRVMTEKYCSANPSVNELVSWYDSVTSGLQNDPISQQPWAFGQFGDGTKIGRAHRLIFRSRADLQRRFPDPFEADQGDEKTYAGWCRLRGTREYPELLPSPLTNADWSEISGPLIPSIAPPAGVLPSVVFLLRVATADPKKARLLGAQVRRVWRREGLRGLLARIRRAIAGN